MAQIDDKQFGRLEGEFSTNQIARYFFLLVGVGCFVAGLYFVIKPFLETKEPVILILVPAVGLVCCACGAFILRLFFKKRGGQIRVYENGLEATLDGRYHAALWSEIASVSEFVQANYVNGIHASDTYIYTVTKTDGDFFTFDNIIFQTKFIGQRVKEKTFELMYPPARQRLKRGEKIEFGSLSIDSNGLSENSKQFLWSNLSRVKVKDGIIQVKDAGGKTVFEKAYAATPNAHVLFALLPEFITVE